MKHFHKKLHLSFPMTITSAAFILIFLGIMHEGIWTKVFWVFLLVIGFLEVYFGSILKTIIAHKNYPFTKFLAHLSAFSFLTILLFGFLYAFFPSDTNFLFNTYEGGFVNELADNLETSVYFSGVTLLSIGYGEIIPYGFFRLLALVEGFIGSFIILSFFSIGISQIFFQMRTEIRREEKQVCELKESVNEEERELKKMKAKKKK